MGRNQGKTHPTLLITNEIKLKKKNFFLGTLNAHSTSFALSNISLHLNISYKISVLTYRLHKSIYFGVFKSLALLTLWYHIAFFTRRFYFHNMIKGTVCYICSHFYRLFCITTKKKLKFPEATIETTINRTKLNEV